MKKFRYRLLRSLAHPQLLSLVFAVVVIVTWVHWRKLVGELKLNPWVAVIFLAIIFRPAIVELLRRTDKISTSWAELSMKKLAEDIERAETLEETNDPKVIKVRNYSESTSSDFATPNAEDSGEREGDTVPPLDPFDSSTTIREQASDVLKELDDLDRRLRTKNRPISSDSAINRVVVIDLRYTLLAAEKLILHYFGPEDGPNRFTSETAEYIAAWTGVSGWTNVIDVWRRTKRHLSADRTDGEIGHTELHLMETLVRAAMDILRKQLEAVTRLGRTD